VQIHHLLIPEDGLTCKPVNIYTGPQKILSAAWIEVREIWRFPSLNYGIVLLSSYSLFPKVTTAAELVVRHVLCPQFLPPSTQFIKLSFCARCNKELLVLLLYTRPSPMYIGLEIFILIFSCQAPPCAQ
jgi:hypothetical protein